MNLPDLFSTRIPTSWMDDGKNSEEIKIVRNRKNPFDSDDDVEESGKGRKYFYFGKSDKNYFECKYSA